MFINFFFELKQAKLPVSLKEYLMLMEAMDKRVVDSFDVNDFYYLSRSALVKDERYLDKFDRVFGHSFKGLEKKDGEEVTEIPEEWLRLGEPVAAAQFHGGRGEQPALCRRVCDAHPRHQSTHECV